MNDLNDEMKRCGNYALMLAPLIIQVSQAVASEVSQLDKVIDKAVEGDGQVELVTSLSEKGQLAYDRCLNELFEDIVNLGYYRKLQIE